MLVAFDRWSCETFYHEGLDRFHCFRRSEDSAGAAAHSLPRPRLQPMRMAVDGGPNPRGRMPPAAPDTTQPLETTRRTALATAGACVCGCGAYLATSETRHSSTRRPSRAAHESTRDRAFDEFCLRKAFARVMRRFAPRRSSGMTPPRRATSASRASCQAACATTRAGRRCARSRRD